MAEGLRVLVAGWVNSPHVAAWAELVKGLGHDVHIAGRVAPGWPELDLGVPSHRLETNRPPPLRGFALSRALRRVADDLQPDLVHAHYLPEYGWMAAREGLRPLICSAWGSDVFTARGINRPRSRRALEAASLVFADSAHLARAAGDLARSNVRVELVRWGLDLEAFAPGDKAAAREALGIPLDGPLVVSPRGPKPVYNPELVLRAFDRLRASRPEVRLLVKHPQAKGSVGAHEGVIALGNVSADRVPDVYRAADVVVSVASSDSSPRSVWEALACGRPVIVSDLPWAREELAPGGQALLAPLQPDAVAEAIGRVLDDAALAERLAASGRTLAVSELDSVACAARVEQLYRSVL